MARYTGPEYKKSRRVGFSILESGKELARKPYGPGQHGRDKKQNHLTMVFNYKKNKNKIYVWFK